MKSLCKNITKKKKYFPKTCHKAKRQNFRPHMTSSEDLYPAQIPPEILLFGLKQGVREVRWSWSRVADSHVGIIGPSSFNCVYNEVAKLTPAFEACRGF